MFVPASLQHFNPDTSTITLDSRVTAAKQIEYFVHEATHATHHNNKAMFLNGKLSKEDYIKLGIVDEVNCFEAMIKVNRELTSRMGSVGVLFGNRRNSEPDLVNLSEVYATQGRAGVARIVIDEAKNVFPIHGKPQLANYRDFISEQYDLYNTDFDADAEKYRNLYIKRGPAVRKLLDEGF